MLELWHLDFLWHFALCFCGNGNEAKQYLEIPSANSTIESEHSQPSKTISITSEMVFGAMLLFIYNLTRIFYEILLSLYQNWGAKWQKREVAISHNCKVQLIPSFYSQLRSHLIINNVYFLHGINILLYRLYPTMDITEHLLRYGFFDRTIIKTNGWSGVLEKMVQAFILFNEAFFIVR